MTTSIRSFNPLLVSTIQTHFDKKVLPLEIIREARGDINEIRMLLKGSKETCLNLFKQAVEEGDAISQIQLSQAFFGIAWGKDESKDFSLLSARDLETFSYYPRSFGLFNEVYDQAMGEKFNLNVRDARGTETFRSAASRPFQKFSEQF